MPNYVRKALKQFQHKLKKKQHQPFPNANIIYGAKKQYATEQSSAPLLDKEGKKFTQLLLGRAVNSTILCPISAIAFKSAAPMEDTM